jgi:putative oxidoreductase
LAAEKWSCAMSVTAIQSGSRWKPISVWILKGLLAATFLAAGAAKLYGVPMLVENFERIGFGQWFRYVTGLLEIAGAIALLLPSIAALGALLLSCIMIGAIITHLFIGGSAIPAIVLLLLCAIVVFVHRDQIDALLRTLSGDEA